MSNTKNARGKNNSQTETPDVNDSKCNIDTIIKDIKSFYDNKSNKKLDIIIEKLEKIKVEKENTEKKLKIAEDRIKEYNRCVDIVRSRYLFGIAFNDTIVNMVDNAKCNIFTQDIVGFEDALPRQMIEIMFHRIGEETDGLCKKIIDNQLLSYILLDSAFILNDRSTSIISKNVAEVMNIIRDASMNSDLYFGPYKITKVEYNHDSTYKNMHYRVSATDNITNDDVFISFWLQTSELKTSSLNISSLFMNNNGLIVRTTNFASINDFEKDLNTSVLNMKVNSTAPVYGGFFQVVNDIINCKGRILCKKNIQREITQLNTHILDRSQKVTKMMFITEFLSHDLDTLVPRYINNTNFSGLPEYYIETKEECLYTSIDPPYIKVKLTCGHDISLHALYGLLIDGQNDDSEAIVCQLCRAPLKFKLFEYSDAEKEKYKNDKSDYPRIYTRNDFEEHAFKPAWLRNSVSSRESNEYIDRMHRQYMINCSHSDLLEEDESYTDSLYDNTDESIEEYDDWLIDTE